MSGRHVVGAGDTQPAEPAVHEIADPATADPDTAVEPPEQYVEPVEEHAPTSDGPAQWEGDAES